MEAMPDKKNNRSLYRLIDANLNRASEGLRVIEDTYRFIYDKKQVYLSFRILRHKLNKICVKIYPELISSRDSEKDSGRKLSEVKREGVKGLIVANFKRVEQAVRVLEEYSRIVSPEAGKEFKRIRYKLYTLEKNCVI